MLCKSSRTKSYAVTHKFIPKPGWQKDYDEAVDILARILLLKEKTNDPADSRKPIQRVKY